MRDLTAQHGVVLIFDEVKTGATIAAGGATEHFGVMPDSSPGQGHLRRPARRRDRHDRRARRLVADGTVLQQGTFNGNPLVMAAAAGDPCEVLTPEAYAHFDPPTRG